MSENLRQDRESPRKHCVFEGFGAPAGTRTPDTLLKRQVLYLLSYWGISSEQALERLASVAVPPLKREGLIPRRSPTRSPAQRVRVGRGRRNLRIRSFRRPGGSGVDQVSSDVVAGMAGLEPTISESKSGVLPLHYIPIFHRGRHGQPLSILWGGIWGSNPRHPEPQSGALPTELIPPNTIVTLISNQSPAQRV